MNPYYYNAFEKGADFQLNQTLCTILRQKHIPADNTVILCIGTDRATGDCLGPLVGDYLQKTLPDIAVYGTLESPVHALNLEETIHSIHQSYESPFIIAIDASLGTREHIGYATLSHTPLIPGKGVNKKLPAIGDVSITGIVNISGQSSHLLQSTRLHIVMQLADYIAQALKYTIDYFEDFCPL